MTFLYRLKKIGLTPYKLYMRQKNRHLTGFRKAAFELHYYRPSLFKFFKAHDTQDILHQVDLPKNSVVLDIGAYTGDWSKILMKLYDPYIIAFEPDPKNFKSLSKLAETHCRLTPLPYGVSDKDQRAQLSLSHMGSSIFPPPNSNGNMPTAEIELRAIDKVWNSLNLTTVNLMKINIEGGEFPLLEHMIECDMLKNVDTFMIQFHEWHPRAYHRRRKIRKALSKTHNCVWDYYFVWEKWDRK